MPGECVEGQGTGIWGSAVKYYRYGDIVWASKGGKQWCEGGPG